MDAGHAGALNILDRGHQEYISNWILQAMNWSASSGVLAEGAYL
jgi:hypothetical protein